MIIKTLNEIQTKLVSKKDMTNEFAKFKYRTAEGILESVKPLLNGCAIVMTDDLITVDGRAYIKATATLMNDEGESISSTAFAEIDSHKGMSKEQCCGSASSYAHKYALQALLGTDSNTDVDSLDNTAKGEKIAPKPQKSVSKHNCADCGKPIEDAKKPNGETWKANDLAKYTKMRFGDELCYECAEIRFKKENEE